MWDVIHKETGQFFRSFDIRRPGLFKNKDVNKEIWIVPRDAVENWDEINEKEIYVLPVKASIRKGRYVSPYFRLFPNSNKLICFVKESDEHKMKKTVMYNILSTTFDFKFKYDNEIYPVKDLPINYILLRKNIKVIEVKKNITTTNEYKVSDVHIPFIYTAFWGSGVVIEIKVSEGKEKEEEKEDFWFQRGKSIIWMGKNAFKLVDSRWSLEKNELDVIPYCIGHKKIDDNREKKALAYLQEMHNLVDEVKEMTKNIFEMIKNAPKQTCRVCKHGSEDNKRKGMIACWYKKKYGLKHGPEHHEPLDSCEHWERRGSSYD